MKWWQYLTALLVVLAFGWSTVMMIESADAKDSTSEKCEHGDYFYNHWCENYFLHQIVIELRKRSHD